MASSRRTGGNPDVATYGTGKTHTEGNFSVWESATDVNQVTATASDILEVYSEGVAGALWDDIGDLLGATCSAVYFRVVRPASGEGHSGIPANDGSMAGFKTTTQDSSTWSAREDYSLWQDMVFHSATNSASWSGVGYASGTSSGYIGCIIMEGSNADTGGVNGFQTVGTPSLVINCLAYNVKTRGAYVSSGTLQIYNYTENSCGVSLRIDTGCTANSQNCVLDDAVEAVGTHNETTNTNGTPTYIGGVDFHLASNDVTALDQGTDLSADGTFDFDDDIDGVTRTGTWDIGFDEYVAAGGKASKNTRAFPLGERAGMGFGMGGMN